MEDNLFKILVELESKDGRYYYNILANHELDSKSIMSILSGALALVIRGEETPELRGKALKDVIKHLESEFINIDSFSDYYIKK
jgi:endonuclease III-like uncharacterized protein